MLQLIKIFSNRATFVIDNTIITIELDNESEKMLKYYNRLPANS